MLGVPTLLMKPPVGPTFWAVALLSPVVLSALAVSPPVSEPVRVPLVPTWILLLSTPAFAVVSASAEATPLTVLSSALLVDSALDSIVRPRPTLISASLVPTVSDLSIAAIGSSGVKGLGK